MSHSSIHIEGARQHNLKNLTLDIPRDQLVVVCGPSGSGKSTLAFDIVYAEGQRRYVESLLSLIHIWPQRSSSHVAPKPAEKGASVPLVTFVLSIHVWVPCASALISGKRSARATPSRALSLIHI